MDTSAMLEAVKKVRGITNNDFDNIINNYILAGIADLIAVGISAEKVLLTDPLIYSAVMSFVLSLLDTENAELYANAYALQKDAVRRYGIYQ